MKINELCIGDWVATPMGDMGYIVALTAHDTTHGMVEVVEDEEGAMFKWESQQLSPIPISAEVLEKNGLVFVDIENDECYDLYANSEVMVYHNKKGKNWSCATPTVNATVHSIHELQHTLQLARITLKIRL